MSVHRMLLPFDCKMRVVEFLKQLGQDTVDKANMSYDDIAKRASQQLNIPNVTKYHVRELLKSAGMRAAIGQKSRIEFRMSGVGPKLRRLNGDEHTKLNRMELKIDLILDVLEKNGFEVPSREEDGG